LSVNTAASDYDITSNASTAITTLAAGYYVNVKAGKLNISYV
jgi:hypothetical protein